MSNKTVRVNNDDRHGIVEYLIPVRDNDTISVKCLKSSFI